MKSKEKNISIKIADKHLDALEDLLYCELTDEQREKHTKDAKKLWRVLVKAYDKKK